VRCGDCGQLFERRHGESQHRGIDERNLTQPHHPDAPDSSVDTVVLVGPYEDEYDLEGLESAAEIVAVVRSVGDGRVDTLPGDDVPFTISEIELVNVVKGDPVPAGATLPLRQLGSMDSNLADTLVTNGEYLLFLVQYDPPPGVPPGEYIPVGGDQGVFVSVPDEANSYERVGAGRPATNPDRLQVVDEQVIEIP